MKNTFKNNGILLWITIFLCTGMIWSCSQWDDYKKYTKDGEIEYTGKFDTAIISSGKERVRIYGELMADPKIAKCRIFWNNKADSIEYDINLEKDKNIFDKTFSVDEGVKSFAIYTYDALGKPSVAVNAIGTSYGQRYRNKLVNRRIKSIDYDTDTTMITWDDGVDFATGPMQIELTYPALTGDSLIVVPTTKYNPNTKKDELIKQTILRRFKYQTETFKYRTVFRPDKTCIDTFCTAYKTIIPLFVNKELDRSLFKEYPLTGDTGPNSVGLTTVSKMWDGLPNAYDNVLFTSWGATTPQMITFDVGLKAKLTKVVIVPFKEWWGSYYVTSTIRKYEIWGSAKPSVSGALDASWKLLASGTIVKPSGGAKDVESVLDQTTADNGFKIDLDSNASKVRYLRIRCLQNYNGYYDSGNPNQAFFSVGEIKVLGDIPQ